MRFLLIACILLVVSGFGFALSVDERQDYLDYFGYNSTVCDERNCTVNPESGDEFIARVRSEIIREPYDAQLCGFERVLNTTPVMLIDEQGNVTLVPNTSTYNVMSCTRNLVLESDYVLARELGEIRNVRVALEAGRSGVVDG